MNSIPYILAERVIALLLYCCKKYHLTGTPGKKMLLLKANINEGIFICPKILQG
jgi:hypothetical protein